MGEDTLFSGESVNVEYKVNIPKDSSKYMKTVVAYANGNGGKIVFGVDDKTREVAGIDSDNVFQKIDSITNAISDSCEPRIVPDITLQTVEDKTVIVVEIAPGRMRPYYLKSKGMVNGTYTRSAGTSRPVSDYMLKELILEGQNRYYDCEVCEDLTVTSEDIEQLCIAMKAVAMRNTLTEGEKRKVKDVTLNVLLSWGVLAEQNGSILPTNAYALLTGQAKFQPVIQCAVFKGTDRAYFVDQREFEGPIQDQMEAAFQYVLEKINCGMRIQGMYRQDVYELPIDSVREIIANSVAHRSYLEPGNIQVALYDDRLEVTSPGMLMNGVTIQKMKAGYSKPRNRAIAYAFSYMKIIERWGSGIPRLLRECSEYGLPEPELIDLEGDFRVNLYRRMPEIDKSCVNDTKRDTDDTKCDTDDTKRDTDDTKRDTNDTKDGANDTKRDTENAQNDDISENESKVLNMIRENPSITQVELKEKLHVSIATVKRLMVDLQRRGLIERQGSNRSGEWIVREVAVGSE